MSVLNLYMFTWPFIPVFKQETHSASVHFIGLTYCLFSRYFSNQIRDVFTEEDFELYRYDFSFIHSGIHGGVSFAVSVLSLLQWLIHTEN